MAEHFHGRFRALHTTSGGGELFLRSLLAVGELSPASSEPVKKLLDFIRERTARGNGWFHIPLYPLPEAFTDRTSLLFLASTTERLAQALIDNDLPKSVVKEFDNRDFRLRWVAFALEFYELIRESVDFGLPDISPHFQDKEVASIVSISRLWLRWSDAKRNDCHQEQLSLLNEIVELESSRKEPANLCSIYLEKAEMELKLGDAISAIESLTRGASHATGEERESLLQLAASLRSQT